VKPFFSIYPSCRKPKEELIDLNQEDEQEEEEVLVDLDVYWCDKSKNRTSECQNWVSPEEQAAIDALRAEKLRKKR